MGFFSEIYHASRAEALEKQGEYVEAVYHVLRGNGAIWEKKGRAGRLLQRAGRYREAIPYYREAINESPHKPPWEWEYYSGIVECYEALGEYSGAMEIHFAWLNFLDIYQRYKHYRSQSSSFKLSRSRFKEGVALLKRRRVDQKSTNYSG